MKNNYHLMLFAALYYYERIDNSIFFPLLLAAVFGRKIKMQ